MSEPDNRQQEEAREILKRVENNDQSIVLGSLKSASDRLSSHFTAQDADRDDSTVKWATRIGRVLGLAFFVLLIINLFTGWFF